MNLKTKFHLASACLVLLVVTGVIGTLALTEKRRILDDIEREQREDLDKFARVCEDMMATSDEVPLFKYVQNMVELSAPRMVYAGVIYEKQGTGEDWIVSWEGDKPVFLYVDRLDPAIQSILRTKKFLTKEVNLASGKITELSRPVDVGYVRLGYSNRVANEIYANIINRYLRKLGLVSLFTIAFGLLLAHLFSKALSRPINLLMEAAESIASGKKGIKIPEGNNDEIGRLTKTFNHMSEELIKLDQLKDDFMSHVTHELRSPLTSIIATVELMAEMPLAGKDPKFRRSIDRLMYGSERLNRLVDNILDLTRMEAGKMTFDIQPVDICKIAAEMADFFEPRAMEKGLKIQAIVPPEFPLVLADSERIRQALSNLIHNAIKFTNKGGIVVWVRQKDGAAQIGVQDTGVGIPRDQLATVFRKFETLKYTRDTVDKPMPGSGLGLNIVENSIKAQGGKIWVESEIEKGSTFIFTLAFAPANQQKASMPVATGNAQALAVPPQASGERQAIILEKPKVAV